MNALITAETQIVKSELMKTGWDLPANMTEDDWRNAGSFLVQVDQARQWWLGDWWNSCQWGEGQTACNELDVNYENAIMCGKVSRSFEIGRRRPNLSFSHHKEVTFIKDPDMQDKLLDWCLSESKRKTVKELRQKVQDYLAMADWSESEKNRRFDIESGITVVSNMRQDANLINWAKTEGLFVEINRNSPWGNPFEIPHDGNRDDVCESYEIYFPLKKSLHKKIPFLKGKVLGCHCYPKRCHGDYLAEMVNHED